MKKLSIGSIYQVKYDSTGSTRKKIKNPTTITMGNFENLAADLQARKDEIAQEQKARSVELKPYFSLLKKLDKQIEKEREDALTEGKEKPRFSQKVKDLKVEVENMKSSLFGSAKAKSKTEKTQSMFIRNFDPEKLVETEEGFSVLYAGKRFTTGGKEVHQFYRAETVVDKDTIDGL